MILGSLASIDDQVANTISQLVASIALIEFGSGEWVGFFKDMRMLFGSTDALTTKRVTIEIARFFLEESTPRPLGSNAEEVAQLVLSGIQSHDHRYMRNCLPP